MKLLLGLAALVFSAGVAAQSVPDVSTWKRVESGKTPGVKGFVNVQKITTYKVKSDPGKAFRQVELMTMYDSPEKVKGETILAKGTEVLVDCAEQQFVVLKIVIFTDKKQHSVPVQLTFYVASPSTLSEYQVKAVCEVPENQTKIELFNGPGMTI